MTLHYARFFILLLAATALPVLADNIAVVNGKAISLSNLEIMVKAQTARGNTDSPELRAQVKQQLIKMELLSQEGAKLNLDKQPEVKNELDLAHKEILSRAMIADFAKKNPVKESEIKAEYEKYVAQVTGLKEYLARHIQVDKEDEAKEIISKLKAGGKFEDLVKQSKDESTVGKGGVLDWAPSAKYPQSFADALTALQKGQVSETPVKTQFGYHVIKVDDIRPVKIATLEEAKSALSKRVMIQKIQNFQQELLKKAKIVE